MPEALPTARVRALLVLGRVSNLPTVWSNCFAAWLLSGGTNWDLLVTLCCAGSLLYTGGMFLNDAFDVDFDRRYRPERPIVSGRIAARTVWIFGSAMLLLGLLLLWKTGFYPGFWGSVLVIAILCYNAIHKKTAMAPVIMALCRVLLYLVAGSAAGQGISRPLLWAAAALGLYVLGISFMARVESNSGVVGRWPFALLLFPILIGVPRHFFTGPVFVASGLLIAWLCWCLLGGSRRSGLALSSGIAGLLAGIVLVDLLAVSPSVPYAWAIFLGLFVAAVLFQRLAPAT